MRGKIDGGHKGHHHGFGHKRHVGGSVVVHHHGKSEHHEHHHAGHHAKHEGDHHHKHAAGGAVKRKAGGAVSGAAPKMNLGKVARARGGRMTPSSPLTGATVKEKSFVGHDVPHQDEGGEGATHKRARGGALKRARGGKAEEEHEEEDEEHRADRHVFAHGGRAPMHLHLKKGALHHDLGVPEGHKIPEAKLEAAKHSSSPLERKRATFAENAKHWHHGK